MAQPLELSYNWRTPVVISTVALIACCGFVADSRAEGWQSVALTLVALWALLMIVVWLRTRAFMLVGPLLTVRRFRRFDTIDARSVTAVTEFTTPSGPSYRVVTTGADGVSQQHTVPAALLRTGHSTFFDWVLTWAPEASLDRGCRRTIDTLRTRGLVE
jgi:hypothetical protein